MSEVDCPLGCGYVGEPSSVEAHISAKADDVHQGEVGRFYEDELREGSVDEDAAVLEDDLEEPGHEEMDVDEDVDDDLDVDREVAAGAAGAAVSAPFVLEEIDVDTRVLLLGALALMTLLAFYLRRRGDGSDEEPEPAEEPAEEPVVDGDGGLVA